MRVASVITLVIITIIPAYGYGQESLVGKYVGEFVVSSFTPGRDRSISLELVIESSENGLIKGIGRSQSKACSGASVPIVGKLEGNKLEIRAAEERANCPMQYSLTIDGNKLVGTTRSGYPAQLRKQSSIVKN